MDGFVHPASIRPGRSVVHLAATVSLELFAAELAAVAQEMGAGPRHTSRSRLSWTGQAGRLGTRSRRLRVPSLPACSSCPPTRLNSSRRSIWWALVGADEHRAH